MILLLLTCIIGAVMTSDRSDDVADSAVDTSTNPPYTEEIPNVNEPTDTSIPTFDEEPEATVFTEEEPITESESVKEKTYIQYYTEQDAIDIAKVLYRECRGVPSVTEQACVAWTVLNRVDCDNSTIYSVIRAPNQFAFNESTKVDETLLELAYDVLGRWNREKNGDTDVGRALPIEYRYFEGYDGHNHFRDQYDGSYSIWDYSMSSPYES